MTWNKYETAYEKGPAQFGRKIIWLILGLVLIVGPLIYIGGWLSDAASVAKKEFSASALLKKYEWFKNASAQLDKKLADIKVYDSRIKAMPDRKEMDRTEKEQFMLWHTELAGVKASYNGLAAEYNAQMSKFNWRFTNAGTLPKGATEVLPRSFRQYKDK